MQKLLIEQLFTNFLISVKLDLVLDTLPMSVNMPYRMGQKLSFRLLLIFSPNIDGFYRFYQCYCPANNFQWRFMTNLTIITTPKTCGYTTFKNNCFQKLCRRSTVTSHPTCAYWRECKHNLKLKRKLNFLAHPVRQYRLNMFTNTGSVPKTKSNLT